MKLALDANVGSVDRWREEFLAMGRGGIDGWKAVGRPPVDKPAGPAS